MKYLFFLFSCINLMAFDLSKYVEELKWVQDYEILVALNAKTKNTLIGIDSNNNGVRDDVEYYISKKYSDDIFQKDMFLSSAKIIQDIFKLPEDTSVEVRVRLDNDLLKIYTCRDYILYKQEDPIKVEKELKNKMLIKGKILNTRDRLRAYIDHKDKLPFSFDDLSEEQLNSDKKSCINIYKSYQNSDEDNKMTNMQRDTKVSILD